MLLQQMTQVYMVHYVFVVRLHNTVLIMLLQQMTQVYMVHYVFVVRLHNTDSRMYV